ncbi:Uncharacterised protein [Segatella copri]|nr:Uncharacterised protein [Segatella copri]
MISIFVTFINKKYSLLTFIHTEQIHILIFIASGDKFLQTKKLKVVCEISKKVTYTRVVTIA